MPCRQPRAILSSSVIGHLPTLWLFTDERNDAELEKAIRQLPCGSGIIFRHYHLPVDERKRRFSEIEKQARRYGHLLLLADTPQVARSWRAQGSHARCSQRSKTLGHLHSAPVHNAREIHKANRNGAMLFFLSPAFPTRSHPGAKSLNRIQVKRLATLCRGPVFLLGGMNRKRFQSYRDRQIYGWAAISALSR